MITVKKTFEVDMQNDLKKVLNAEQITALSIWLVEALNNKDIPPLYFNKTRFVWREPEHEFIYVTGQQNGMNFLHVREMLDKIENLAGDSGDLLDDTYPAFTDHPNDNHQSRYLVIFFNNGKLLGFVDTREGKSVLPIALRLNEELGGYEVVESHSITTRPWWDFN
ncbi:hypothetical protein PQD71_gp023 [Kosakonia phage Kc263]|uniref:Uncharacterized protein n=1 Tax=Kosakonia phage Kc263 TaxID=2863194 RepID=A0AAE7WF46_9CAUD|nr:hypothetical protein PQD71_gp023 [Kosakonia phage Kc263]QYN79916.1 hypothetical protein [Kosakonia phage Kc263]